MSSLSSAFAHLYLFFGVVASAGILFRITRNLSAGARTLSAAMAIPLIFLYLVGMNRTAGVDYDTYAAAYTDQGQAIPDIGYTALTAFLHGIGINFDTFLLLQGIFTLLALWIVARAKRADPVVVIVIYLLHLAIVRDLSQSRIGLAVAIYLLGQTRENWKLRTVLYIFAGSVHITVIILMLLWSCAIAISRMKVTYRILFAYFPMIVFAIYGSMLLNVLGAIDPRVEFYLAWDDDGYGAPLASYGAIIRAVPVIAILWFAPKKIKGLHVREYIMMELAGLALLIGFAQFSIFAARLSNVAISMYPIALGFVIQAYRENPAQKRGPYPGPAIWLSTFLVLIVLTVRPGSFDALEEIVPATFLWATN